MYTIFKVVYGVPLNKNDTKTKWSKELEDALDNQAEGFLTYYSGAGDTVPAAFGIELDEFDDACHHVELLELITKPAWPQWQLYGELFAQQTPKMQKEIAKYGQPRVFFLFTTS